MTTAYLCLGSNINPKRHIRFAIERFKKDFEGVIISNIYKSKAVGFDGKDFLNLAVAINTNLSLDKLLKYTDALEKSAGRTRVKRGNFDSRTLDVDVVMYGNLTGKHKGRHWPSEDIQDNAHVLLPMSEIAGHRKHPELGVNFNKLWEEFKLDGQCLKRIKQI